MSIVSFYLKTYLIWIWRKEERLNLTKGDGTRKLVRNFVVNNILVTLVHEEEGRALGAPKNFPFFVVIFVEIS